MQLITKLNFCEKETRVKLKVVSGDVTLLHVPKQDVTFTKKKQYEHVKQKRKNRTAWKEKTRKAKTVKAKKSVGKVA